MHYSFGMHEAKFDNSEHGDTSRRGSAPGSLHGLRCRFSHERFEIHNGGDVYHCCPTWLPRPIGNITESSLLAMKAAATSTKIRHSIEQEGFSLCEQKLCPYISEYLARGRLNHPLERQHTPGVEAAKVDIMLNYDFSCNLRCPSCRNELIMYAADKVPARLAEIHAAATASVQEFLEKGYQVNLNITGSGDAFASLLYSRYLANLPFHERLRLELQTNGLLMTPERMPPRLRKMTEFIAVSVDAMDSATYAVIRRGGNLARLQQNVIALDRAIQQGEYSVLKNFKLNFIVQQENYREIGRFARWAAGFASVTEIWFNLIADWGHLDRETFAAKAIWHEEHPEHRLFLQVLQDDFLLRDARINLGNLTHFIQHRQSSPQPVRAAHPETSAGL